MPSQQFYTNILMDCINACLLYCRKTTHAAKCKEQNPQLQIICYVVNALVIILIYLKNACSPVINFTPLLSNFDEYC